MKKTAQLIAGILASAHLLTVSADEPCFMCGNGCGIVQNHIYGGAEALYWTVFQTNLDYAVDFDDEGEINELLGPGNTHFLTYPWKPGGRAWLGWEWCSGWDTRVVYTYYYNSATGHTNGDLLASLLHPATLLSNATEAHGHNHLTYQTVDLLLGRVIHICDDTFMMRPFFGVRGLKLDEELRVTYEGDDFIENPARVAFDSDLQAVGLHAGLASNYSWPCGLAFYSGFAGSLLATRTDVEHRQYELDEDFDIVDVLIDLDEREYIVIPALHINAGLEWDYRWGSCLTIRFKAGYEFNEYFDTPQLRRYHYGIEGVSNSGSCGNITLQGATASIELYF